MKTVTLRADQVLQENESFHFARAVLSRQPVRQLHDHDYFELFWLHHGRARHFINGETRKLTEGDLVFIRPADCHALQGQGDETHIVNIIFPAAYINDIAARHGLSNSFFWTRDPQPFQTHRDIRQLAELSRRALHMETGPRSLLSAEAFLLPLLSDLLAATPALPDAIPEWLINTCAAAQDPEVFRQGAAGLVSVSGRAHAHVSRSFQRYLGETPSDYVNTIRMTHAARALTGTSDGLAEIARDCGIPNLSHFHRLFREHHAMTPNQFRSRYQKNAIQPV